MVGLRAIAVAAVLTACAASTPTLRERAESASAQGKTVVVEFYATWCKVCDRFRATVLPDPRVQVALDAFSYVSLDGERGVGRAEAARLGVGGYPTFVALDRRGEPVAAVRGSATVEHFISFLQWARVYAADEQSVRAGLDGERAWDDVLVAARFYAHAGRVRDALPLYDELLAARVDADVAWERSQVASSGATRRHWAQAAARYLGQHPRSRYSGDAFKIAVLSGGLPMESTDALIEQYLARIADDASLLDDAVHVLLAAGRTEPALQAASALVERWPKMHLFRASLDDARAGHGNGERAAAHREWVAGRLRDLRIK